MAWMARYRRLVTPALLAAGLLAAFPAGAAEIDTQACLAALRNQARAQGLSAGTLEQAFETIELRDRVIELDRSQPEFLSTIWDYLHSRVDEERVALGRELKRRHGRLLRRIHRDYGIRPEYLLAFWGMETNFGRYFGDIPVLDSLATLACDSRRATFFTTQFLEALQIVERGEMPLAQMRGSWAGAMGHTQFLPSTFNSYAVDYDGDGRRDLYNSLPDALASAANYLRAIGWEDGRRWGREVRLPADFNWALAGYGKRRPLAEWRRAGVMTARGEPVPAVPGMQASLLLPAGRHGPAFLVYANFDVILEWNRSLSYALAVGHLADRIAGLGRLRSEPRDLPRLRTEEVREIQARLNRLGYAAGPVDGIMGSRTRAAIEAFQAQHGLPADGYPDRTLIAYLRAADAGGES